MCCVCCLLLYMVKIVGLDLDMLNVRVFFCLLNVFVLLNSGNSDLW